ncbi:hypothetical protein BDF22DRAFT_668580, partial [Syncephalis plumigaleata]
MTTESCSNDEKVSNTPLNLQEFLSELKERATRVDKGKAARTFIDDEDDDDDDSDITNHTSIITLRKLLDFAEQYEDDWFDNEETRNDVAYQILTLSPLFHESSIRLGTCQLLLEAATQLYGINTGKVPERRSLLVCELLVAIIRSKPATITVDRLAQPGSLDVKMSEHQANVISSSLALLQCGWQVAALSRLLIVIMNLCLEFCRLDLLPEEQIDGLVISGLLNIIDATCYDQNDETTNTAIYLFVAIHRVLIKHDPTRLGTLSDNIILCELAQRPESNRTFGECFVFLLNREENAANKYMCIELLFSILKSPPLSNYFYRNDRNVILDILLQNIADLEDNRNDILVLCLNALNAIICYTDYREYPHKLSQVRRLLRELLNTSNVSNGFHRLAREVFNNCSEALAEVGCCNDDAT